MIGYFLTVVGTTISIANPVVEAAEVAGPQQKESKTYKSVCGLLLKGIPIIGASHSA